MTVKYPAATAGRGWEPETNLIPHRSQPTPCVLVSDPAGQAQSGLNGRPRRVMPRGGGVDGLIERT